ncbi:MAG: hypothetical protein RR248_01370 [Clostridia bacterium]
MTSTLSLLAILLLILPCIDLAWWLIRRYLSLPTDKQIGNFFGVCCLVAVGSLLLSINYVDISRFVKSLLSEEQIIFVRDIIGNISSGGGAVVVFNAITSQLMVVLSMSFIVYGIKIFYFFNFLVTRLLANIAIIKVKFISRKVNSRRLHLQFSRFNQ